MDPINSVSSPSPERGVVVGSSNDLASHSSGGIDNVSQTPCEVSAIPLIIKAACWNMRCNFDLDRVESALQAGKFDILMLADCQPKQMARFTTSKMTCDIPLSEVEVVPYAVISSRDVGLATRLGVIRHELSDSGRILYADCRVEDERVRVISVYVRPAIPRRSVLCELTCSRPTCNLNFRTD